MTTALHKPITRLAMQTIRDAGKFRRLVVTLHPAGLVGIRPQGTRREEHFPIDEIYYMALKARVRAEQTARRLANKRGRRS